MSVSDPAINDLKAYIRKFSVEKFGIIDDNHRLLPAFCQKLESIFTCNLKGPNNFFTKTQNPFDWVCEISKDKCWNFPFKFINSLQETRDNGYLKSKLGKFRLFLRHTLVNKCLHVPLEYLIRNGKSTEFYRKTSIVGDEILSQILHSVLLQCSLIKFKLDLKNFYFLDATWLLPDYISVELVPSKNIGLSVTFSEEKAVIIDVNPHGAAAEDGRIDVGDILESINGIEINSTCRGRLKLLMRRQKGIPLNIIILKATKISSDNSLYIPIRKYLLDVNLDILSVQNKSKKKPVAIESKEVFREGYRCIFVGSVRIGPECDSRQIEKTIREIMKNKHHGDFAGNVLKFNTSVYLQIDELSVKTVDSETGKALFDHTFMEISACGPSAIYYNHFGYIQGHDENHSEKFTCFIFCTRNKEDAEIILSSICEKKYVQLLEFFIISSS